MHFPTNRNFSRQLLSLQRIYWKANLLSGAGRKTIREIALLDGKETLNLLIQQRLSFSRFGEGELRLAFQQSGTVYDDASLDLGNSLREILLHKNDGILVGYNNLFSKNHEIRWIRDYLRSEKEAHYFESIHTRNDVLVLERRKLVNEYRKYLRLLARDSDQKVLGEASVFSLGTYVEDFRNGTLDEVKTLIVNLLESNSLLVIAPEKPASGRPLLEILNGKEWRIGKLESIIVPTRNAYMNRVDLMARIGQMNEEIDTVVIQAGAAGSLLSAQIQSRFGIRAIDVGGFGVGNIQSPNKFA